jgi:predicted ATPase/transcriptional regulator with XRE-family HTH domain
MADESTVRFADLLRRARRAAGLSQEELAERAGLSVRAISDLERSVNRSPRRDTLDLLADALGLAGDERRVWERIRRQYAVAAGTARSGASTTGLQSPTPRLTNLPRQTTRFVGRQDEIADIRARLRDPVTRLLTLTGPGGTGKTRLALEAASTMVADYADGVWFVDLSPISDAGLVPAAIAAALGLRPPGEQPLLTALATWLTSKLLLLVLDNLEQILDAAPLIGELLSSGERVQVLTTSRAPLRIRAEYEYPVAPLPLPPLDEGWTTCTGLSVAGRADAVQLFTDRARAVRPGFTLSDDDLRIVARLCHRLDGLPLGVELAAAGIRLFPPRSLLERLEHQLPLPDAAPRDVPSRQRTLRATMQWSYDLLGSDEQALFRRLSVCKGGWTLEATEAIAGAVDPSKSVDVIAGLGTLVEHSLIQSQPWLDGTPRFRMLETIREFGIEQLEASRERDAADRGHATYFTRLFHNTERDWHSPQGDAWVQRGDAEIDNVRLALDWLSEHEPEKAIELAHAFSWIWFMLGRFQESSDWLERALASAGEGPAGPRAWARFWIGTHAITSGDLVKGRADIEDALATFLDLNDELGIASGFHGLGRIAQFAGDSAEAVRLYDASADHFRLLAVPNLVLALINLSGALLDSGQLDRAAVVLEEADASARQATAWHRTLVLESRAQLSLLRGDLRGARMALTDCLVQSREVRDLRFLAQHLELCARLAMLEDAAEHAVRLLSAAHRMRERVGTPIPPVSRREYDELPTFQDQLGAERWERVWTDGQHLSPSEAIDIALTGLT